MSATWNTRSIRASMFDRLPRYEETDDIVAIAFDSGEVLIGIFERKRPSDKADIVTVKKTFLDVRMYFRTRGLLRICTHVETAQRQDSVCEAMRYVGRGRRYRPLRSLK
jgi:hypothetical protein